MTHPMPNIYLTLSMDEVYSVYCSALSDGLGLDAPPLESATMRALLTTLRGLWADDHAELAVGMPAAPEWLKELARGASPFDDEGVTT